MKRFIITAIVSILFQLLGIYLLSLVTDRYFVLYFAIGILSANLKVRRN